MLPSEALYAEAWSAAGLMLLSRIAGWLNVPIVQADITSIQCTVRDTTNDTITYNEPLTVSAVIFNALQTGAIWTDATGYNFLHTIPATAFPTPTAEPFDRVYAICIRFVPASGEPFVSKYSPKIKRST